MWPLGPRYRPELQHVEKSYQNNMNKCKNNVKVCNHIISTFWSPGLEPGTRARAPQRREAELGLGPLRFGAWAQVLGPKMWSEYENHVTEHVKIMSVRTFTLFSVLFDNMFICSSPLWDSVFKNHISVIFLVIFVSYHLYIFSYFWMSLAWWPCPFRNLWNPCETAVSNASRACQ